MKIGYVVSILKSHCLVNKVRMNDTKKFNNIIKEIIQKSLFTERQIEIMLNQQNFESIKLDVSRGAYYRQVSQCNEKMKKYYYTAILLEGLGISLSDDFNITSQIAQQISQIKDQEFVESESQVMNIIDTAVKRVTSSELSRLKDIEDEKN